MEFKNRADWEWNVISRATLFTVIRHLGRGKRTRQEFITLQQAIDNAKPDPRAMIYPVAANGESFMLPRSQWAEALANCSSTTTKT
jgi:hypothetical protein